MARKHYKALASILRAVATQAAEDQWPLIVEGIARMCVADDKLFDKHGFYQDCGYPHWRVE